MAGRLRAVLCVAGVIFGMQAVALADDTATTEEVRAPIELRFAFAGADLETVLDVVSRATGLPVVRDAAVPEGTITFQSPDTYDMANGLRVLNTILQTKDVTIRVDGDVLRFESLKDMQRANLPTFVDEIPDTITDDQLITVLVTLKAAAAEAIVERFTPMVGEYGQLLALPGQNAIVLTEMAGKSRRLLGLLREADQASPDGQVEVFHVRHVSAASLLKPLTDLMSVKTEKYMPDKKGKLRKVEEVSLQGITFSADERTNSIIAKGAMPALDRLREIITLLDTESNRSDRELRVLPVALLTVDTAMQRLNGVIATMPEGERPVLVPMPEQSAVGVTGSPRRVEQMASIISALEGGAVASGERVIESVMLDKASAGAVLAALNEVLPQSSRTLVRMAAGPDGRSILLSGPASEVQSVRAMVPTLDANAREMADVKVVELHSEGLETVIERARVLGGELVAEVDVDPAADGTTLLTGPQSGVARMAQLLGQLDAATQVETIVDVFEPLRSHPNTLAANIRSLIRAGAIESGGDQIEVLPDASMHAVLVSGPEDEVAQVIALLRDRDEQTPLPPTTTLEILDVTNGDPAVLATAVSGMLRDRARWPQSLRQASAAGMAVPNPTVVADQQSGRLIVNGPTELMPLARTLVTELDRPASDTGAIETRVVQLSRADATNVVAAAQTALTAKSRFAPAARRVTVSAEPASNTVVLTGPVRELDDIMTVISSLDEGVSAETNQVRTVVLEHASAERIAPVVETLMGGEHYTLQQRIEAARRRVALPEARQAVKVAADTRLNAVVIVARPGVLPVAEALVKQLDVADASAQQASALQVVPVRHADATALAQTLQPLLAESGSTTAPVIQVDRASNSLLVRGDADQLDRLRAVVSEIDAAALTSGRRLEVVPVDPSRVQADELAAALQRLLLQNDSSSVEIIELEDLLDQDGPEKTSHATPMHGVLWVLSASAIGADASVPSVSIAVDPDTNSLVLLGGDRAVRRARALLDQLVQQSPSPAGRLRRIDLGENHDPARLATLLTQALGSMTPAGGARGDLSKRVVVVPDPAGKALFVTCTDHDFAAVADVIRAIAPAGSSTNKSVRTIVLERADAGQVASAIQRLYDDRARLDRTRRAVTVIGEWGDSTIMVAASDEDFQAVQELATRLDSPKDHEQLQIRAFPLQHAKAEDVSNTVQNMVMQLAYGTQVFGNWMGRGRGGGQLPGRVAVFPDTRLNALVVTGHGETFDVVEEVVAVIDSDTPAGSLRTVKTYHVAGTSMQNVEEMVSELYGTSRRRWWDNQDETAPVVRLDEAHRVLIVAGNAQQHAEITALLEVLDTYAVGDRNVIRTFALTDARADNVVNVLAGALGLDQNGETSGTVITPEDGGDPVEVRARIVADNRSNSLIVTGSPESMPVLQGIINGLDSVPTVAEVEYHIVSLEHAIAEDLRWNLQQMTMAFDYPRPQVDVNRAENQLIIAATAPQYEQMLSLIQELDMPRSRTRETRFLKLEHAEADKVRQALTVFYGPFALEADTPSKVSVSIVADPSTNSLVVSAEESEWEGIEALVQELDNEAYDASLQVRVLPLSHAEAQSVARAINEAFSREVARGGGKPNRKPSGDDREADAPTMLVQSEEWVSASAEPVTNSVIVAATGTMLSRIEAIVESLDQPNTSVDVQVHVVTLEDSPVTRVAQTLSRTFKPRAEQLRVPLSIEHDAMTNSLIVATSASLIDEIRATAAELDTMAPPSGHGVTIIDLQHIAPTEAIRVIEALGLDDPPRANSMARLVNEPVQLTHVTGRNAVMLMSNPADTSTVVDILKAMDVAPQGAVGTMQIIQLEFTSAQDMADVLGEMLDPSDQQSSTELARALEHQVRTLDLRHEGIGLGNVGVDLTQPIRIVPHDTQNALVVTSTTANVLAIEALVGLLDSMPVAGAAVIRMLPLKNMPAADFQRIAREVFDQSKDLAQLPGTNIFGMPTGVIGPALLDEVALSIDERTNTVVVAGREDAVAAVEVLVERLDSDVATGTIEVKVIPLNWADPGDLAATLHRVLVEGATDLPNASHLQTQVGRLQFNGGDSQLFQPMHGLTFVPQPAIESLVIVGSTVNIQVAHDLIEMLDVEAASPSAAVRVYPVEHATAGQLANMVNGLLQAQLRSGSLDPQDAAVIQSDARTNAMVVSGSAKVFDIVEGLLEQLDSDEAIAFQEIRSIQLHNASASRVASIVQRMMDARAERLRVLEPQTWALERVVVIPDDVSNTLMVAAGAGGFEVIESMLDDLDRASYLNSALVEVIDTGSSSAPRLAETIRRVMERRYADLPGSERRRMMPLIQVDTRSDSLLVTAAPEDLEAIRDLVARLDTVDIDPAVGLHVLPVASGANAEQLAPRIQQLMQERSRSLGDSSMPSDRVTVQYEASINALIVSASDENLVVIEDLLDMLIAAGDDVGDGREVAVIPLSLGQADEVERLLQDLYVREANRSRGQGTVMVSADRNLNSILVNAPPRDVEEIRDLVERLEGTSPADILEIRHVPLSSANAIETVSLIEDVLAGRSMARSRSRQARSTVLRYVREAAQGDESAEMAITTALRETINLTPDIRTNTVIIRAPGDSMQMLVDMIRDLDETSTGSKSMRVFTLKNADATATRAILRDLFRLDEGQDLLVLKPRDTQVPSAGPALEGAPAPDMGDGGIGGTELTAVPDPRQQLAITVDTRTNSLLVSGSPAYLDLVEQVVDSLDSQEANERETLVYQLRNATAEEVAQVLGEFVEQEQRTLIETLGVEQLGSAARMLEREVTIRGDSKSNSVLVSASPRYMERVRDMIDALDVDPPQVLIQVLLAEVSLDGGVNWGVEFSGGPIGGATASSGFSLPAGNTSPILGALGVPTLALGSADFSLVLRALESQGRLHILSNPSVMAANNEQATINVGELIYVAQGAQTYDTGVVSVPLEEKDVGVSLVVTPSINPDGYVRLDVQPTLSKLLSERDEPAVGVTSPRILQRTADTTITVHDGQTVVIGGLINENYEHFEEKVPVLGDLPLFGPLFRSENLDLVRNELVIVITPHVVRSPADLDRVRSMTNGEVGRLNLPEDIADQVRSGEIKRQSLFTRENGRLELRSFDEADE